MSVATAWWASPIPRSAGCDHTMNGTHWKPRPGAGSRPVYVLLVARLLFSVVPSRRSRRRRPQRLHCSRRSRLRNRRRRCRWQDGGLVEYGGRRSRRRRGARPRPARRRSSRATLRRGSRASRGRTRSHAPVVSRSGSGARRSHAAESLIVYLVRSRERARRIGSCAWRELRRGRGACEKEGSEGSRTLRRRAARSPMRGRRRRGRAAGPRGSSA